MAVYRFVESDSRTGGLTMQEIGDTNPTYYKLASKNFSVRKVVSIPSLYCSYYFLEYVSHSKNKLKLIISQKLTYLFLKNAAGWCNIFVRLFWC